jgi:hypothetical protein
VDVSAENNSDECINPDDRDSIREIAERSVEEIAALDLDVTYVEMGEARLHWNCCPACRRNFPGLPAALELAGREYEKQFASELSDMKDAFLAKKNSLMGLAGDRAYVEVLVGLATAEADVHDSLRRALVVESHMRRGMLIGFDPDKREILSQCRKFVASLEADVQRFVIASTLCFELLRPMWEKVGLSPREDPRSDEEILADLDARLVSGAQADPPVDLKELLQQAIAGSGLEPRVLWETIDAAARAHVRGRETNGPEHAWIRKFEEDFDNFSDSMKATQMEAIRLSERSIRKAADYGPEIAERIGPQVYSQLHEQTKRQLEVAEFLYEVNRMEPRYGHGPAINLALACETELNLRLAVPILNELAGSGTHYYRAQKKPGDKRQPPPLIDGNQIQDRNVTLGRIGYYLGHHPDFAERARAHGFDPNAISKLALEVVTVRDRAAHYPICELAEVDKVRSLILRSDGILSLLHPKAPDSPKA